MYPFGKCCSECICGLSFYRLVSTHQHEVGCNRTSSEMQGAAGSLLQNFLCFNTTCPDVPKSHGREAWRWHVNGEDLVSVLGRLQLTWRQQPGVRARLLQD